MPRGLDDVARLVRRAATSGLLAGVAGGVALFVGGLWCLVGSFGAGALFQAAALLFLETCQCTALVGVWVSAESVGLAAFVVLWQVFGDGKTFLVAEQ